MEEITAEVRALSQNVKRLAGMSLLIAMFLVAMNIGLFSAAGRAGPRLLEMRKRSDAFLEENNRLRAELLAVRRERASTTPR